MQVVFEDNHLIVVVKKTGQTVQPEPRKPLSLEEEVKVYLKEKYQKPGAVFLGVIHRLDMPVSGLVLFAKTSKALQRMNEQFQARQVKKIYTTWVQGIPKVKEGLLHHFLKRDEHKNFSKAFLRSVNGSEEAKLNYKVLKHQEDFALLQIELLTGRKHQIRAQLSAFGYPILGDAKYGCSWIYKNQSIALQATELGFEHPISKDFLNLIIPELKFDKSLIKLRI